MTDRWEQMRQRLDAVGPGFCLAKWTQLTLNLQNGTAHSCHHPPVHKIPVVEIEADPSALHNTEFKKQQRIDMLNGGKPKECDYCWRIEDADKNAYSDRHYKSAFSWSEPFFDRIANSNGTENFTPSYVEVSFSHACNFKCMYCSPSISTKWMEEIKQHGAYPTTDAYNNIDWIEQTGKMPIPTREYNPYVEAFWKWWPELYKGLHTFRVTGGEPLMSKDTFRMMDWILETDEPNTDLLLGINSNFCVEDKLFDRFIEKAQALLDSGRIRKLEIYTSAEAFGKKAEYIRDGLDYEKFMSNVERVCKLFGHREDFTLTFMCTYNALSLSSFTNFVGDLVRVREDYGLYSIYIDVSYVRYPEMMDIKILPAEFEHYLCETIDYMEQQEELGLMHESETAKPRRILEYWRSTRHTDQSVHRKNFKVYTQELDKRRGTSFGNTFPEYTNWYEHV
jgi:MoaA/NifB/PqqE/SkfB family radical SAM enzyme